MAKQQQQKPQKGIITLIKEIPVSQATKTIEQYKQAKKAFESLTNPIRVKLYELYDDLLIDGQVEATWGKRRDNILNRRLLFMRDGTEDEEISALLNSPDMRNLLEELHNTILYGYTLVQINDILFDEEQEYYHIDFDLIPRAHVHPEPNFECVSIDANRVIKDWRYRESPLANYMLWAGKPKDKGLLFKVAPYVIYKRGSMGDWSQFSEMFGMPFREALYDAFDDETRTKIEQMMQEWGPGMNFVHPKSVEIKLHDTGGSTSSSDVYDRFIEVCDAAIAKTVLGNTLTTEQGDSGARSLGEVHQGEEDEKKLSDDLFILSILNTQFRAILKRFGFNAKGGMVRFEMPDKDWEELLKKWEVVSGISEKIPLDDDWVYNEFDIPKPDNYDELKEEMKLEKMASMMTFGNPATPEPTSPMEKQPAKKTPENKSWKSRLLNFFGLGRTAERPN